VPTAVSGGSKLLIFARLTVHCHDVQLHDRTHGYRAGPSSQGKQSLRPLVFTGLTTVILAALTTFADLPSEVALDLISTVAGGLSDSNSPPVMPGTEQKDNFRVNKESRTWCCPLALMYLRCY
jgi:hypothetical protein